MKKLRFLCLVLTILLCLVSCGGEEEAFLNSKEAYEKINEAYKIVNQYSHDIYEAWSLGINESRNVNGNYESNVGNFANELSISKEDLERGIAGLLGKSEYSYGDWKTVVALYNSLFSACVNAVSEAYKQNGSVKKVTRLLTEAKGLMKSLGDSYSDYEHYPALKNYFTTTLAMFDFCQNPEGSFDQVVETFNTYRNSARESFFNLNYIFEDSIFGMNGEPEET